jgi:S-adenosylmethionine synthetase
LHYCHAGADVVADDVVLLLLLLLLLLVQVFGEITSHADVDYDAIARQTCHDIGYNHDVSA